MKFFYSRLLLLFFGVGLLGETPQAFGRLNTRVDKIFVGSTRKAEVDVTYLVYSSDDGNVVVSEVTQGEQGVVTITPDFKRVRYAAKPGFNGSDAFTYTLSDGVSSATATVQVYDFASFKGLYALSIGGAGNAGRGQLSVTTSGYLTGKLNFGARTSVVYGRFDETGQVLASHRGAWSSSSPSIFFDLVPGEVNSISGLYYSDIISSNYYEIDGVEASVGGEQTGNYTLLLPRTPEMYYEMPAGTGWARMSVQPSGRVTVTGKLADGSAFSVGSLLDVNRLCYLFAAGPGGFSLGGHARFSEIAEQSDCDGELWWVRGKSKGLAYRAGFEGPVNLLGARFVPPASGSSILSLTEANTVNVKFADGNLSEPLSVTTTVSQEFQASGNGSVLSLAPQYSDKARRSPTGVFNGKFRHPDLKSSKSFSGVFFQKRNIAQGFFRGSTETGTVTLEP